MLTALKVPLDAAPMVPDSEFWRIMLQDEDGELSTRGILVTYVDDLLYLCLRNVMLVLYQAISDTWPRSALELASQEEGIRYSGMELFERDGYFLLRQAGYVSNLLKQHGLSCDASAQLPRPREWLCAESLGI